MLPIEIQNIINASLAKEAEKIWLQLVELCMLFGEGDTYKGFSHNLTREVNEDGLDIAGGYLVKITCKRCSDDSTQLIFMLGENRLDVLSTLGFPLPMYPVSWWFEPFQNFHQKRGYSIFRAVREGENWHLSEPNRIDIRDDSYNLVLREISLRYGVKK